MVRGSVKVDPKKEFAWVWCERSSCVITGTATVLFQGVSVEDILFILDNLTLLRLNRDRFLRLGRLRYNLRALTILGVFVSVSVAI